MSRRRQRGENEHIFRRSQRGKEKEFYCLVADQRGTKKTFFCRSQRGNEKDIFFSRRRSTRDKENIVSPQATQKNRGQKKSCGPSKIRVAGEAASSLPPGRGLYTIPKKCVRTCAGATFSWGKINVFFPAANAERKKIFGLAAEQRGTKKKIFRRRQRGKIAAKKKKLPDIEKNRVAGYAASSRPRGLGPHTIPKKCTRYAYMRRRNVFTPMIHDTGALFLCFLPRTVDSTRHSCQ